MFANLKNKLIEEVKASPSKFQQLANAAQAAVSSSTSSTPSGSDTAVTPNESFFSITEEDTPHNSPHRPLKLPPGAIRGRSTTPQSLINGTGAVPRTRKMSNSSVASDTSFRLPSYESPAVYHLQSDLDESGSEMGDSVSTAKLDVVTKEQLFDAYKRSLDRYHKYRCRYTDLAKKYKDLEHDSSKARAVLKETHDMAIRRINELREQCALEQQAKAHLEEALRVEMDDMNCKMQAYQTKLKLLGENPDAAVGVEQAKESLIDPARNTSEITNGALISFDDDTKRLRIEELEKQLEGREVALKDLKIKFDAASSTIEMLKQQEEENALLLAQTKQAIHSELENKEREVVKLNDTIKQLQNEVHAASRREGELNAEVEEGRELKDKLKQMQNAKQEAEAKFLASEHLLTELKEQFAIKDKSYDVVKEKIASLVKESEQKLEDLRQQNLQLTEIVQRYQENEVSLAEVDNELNRTKNENDNLKMTIQDNERKLQELKAELSVQRREMDADALLDSFKEQLGAKEKELKLANSKSNKQKKQHETQQNKLKEQYDKIESLESEIRRQEQNMHQLQHETKLREDENEKEKSELRMQISNILQEISQMEEQIREVRQSHAELEEEKHNLEVKIENMQQQTTEATEGSQRWREKLAENGEQLKLVESENSQLAERNCLLEENTKRLEKLLAEQERQNCAEEASISEMRAKLETAEATIQKLNEKISQVLDENSHMHNARELMDHDYRTLQDKYDALEKEKLALGDAQKRLEDEIAHLKSQAAAESAPLIEQLNHTTAALKKAEENVDDLTKKLEELGNINKSLQCELDSEINYSSQERESVLSTTEMLNEKQQHIKDLETELQKRDELHMLHSKEIDEANKALKEQIGDLLTEANELKQAKEELISLKSQQEVLESQLAAKINDVTEQVRLNGELTLKIAGYEAESDKGTQTLVALKEELETVKIETGELKRLLEESVTKEKDLQSRLTHLETIKVDEEKYQENIRNLEDLERTLRTELEESQGQYKLHLGQLEEKLASAKVDIETLHESNDAFQVGIDKLKGKHQLEVLQLEASLKQLQIDHGKLQTDFSVNLESTARFADYEKLQVENEYLTRHTNQLDAELVQKTEEITASTKESTELKDRLKSIQCEVYVLKESAEQHDIQLQQKQREMQQVQDELQSVREVLANERRELALQTDHATFVTSQNDTVQKNLLRTQQELKEAEEKFVQANSEFRELKATVEREAVLKEQQMENWRAEIERNRDTIETLNREVNEFSTQLATKESLQQELEAIRIELQELTCKRDEQANTLLVEANKTAPSSDVEHLRNMNDTLQREMEELQSKSSAKITNLQQEVEDLQGSAKEMEDRIMDLERLRAGLQAQQLLAQDSNFVFSEKRTETEDLRSENAELGMKLKTIMNEVQDVSNRNLFLEQKCENYLILEQSNERLKLQNAKLSRQLDETLVSMQHNESTSANTEFEYLKNIMFQYLTGSANGNNETLVKVISAVLKFSPQQTQVALEKEHQRRSLINKIL